MYCSVCKYTCIYICIEAEWGGGGGSVHESPLGLALACGGGVLDLLLQDGDDQVVLGHQVVLHDEAREAVTQERLVLHRHHRRGGGSNTP